MPVHNITISGNYERLLLVRRLEKGNQKDKGTHEQLESSAVALRATNDTEGNDQKYSCSIIWRGIA